MRQWLRKARITFQGSGGGFTVNPSGRVETQELRVSFQVSRGISGSPNVIEVKLWNLTKSHRNAVGKELDLVTVEAGYIPPEGGGNLGIIAKGRLRDVQHDREGPDIITTVSCGDGDLAYRRATVSKTIPKGSSVQDAIDELYSSMEKQGIKKGEWLLKDENNRKFKRPYSMCGACNREMDLLGRSNKFYWSIQNETLEIIPSDGYLNGLVLISPYTGMIGTPTITDNGVKVKCLLNPEIRPNRLIQVESELVELGAQDGKYRVGQVDFVGDNREGDWLADVQGEAINGPVVNEGLDISKYSIGSS